MPKGGEAFQQLARSISGDWYHQFYTKLVPLTSDMNVLLVANSCTCGALVGAGSALQGHSVGRPGQAPTMDLLPLLRSLGNRDDQHDVLIV